ncbi:hypothetical protein AJ80_03698 [Polytolypa hystricis UAMH7299]|uniref:Uncharacterized protein n=1 Tax=Polytolypa hystricis (strain UAMH7299) TaxID=1447883 RepID=A0A2B7YGK5_POLH7|nr:hypothetical protein AJ80_03698 [Polytolypa hystricis UAMH7299]
MAPGPLDCLNPDKFTMKRQVEGQTERKDEPYDNAPAEVIKTALRLMFGFFETREAKEAMAQLILKIDSHREGDRLFPRVYGYPEPIVKIRENVGDFLAKMRSKLPVICIDETMPARRSGGAKLGIRYKDDQCYDPTKQIIYINAELVNTAVMTKDHTDPPKYQSYQLELSTALFHEIGGRLFGASVYRGDMPMAEFVPPTTPVWDRNI